MQKKTSAKYFALLTDGQVFLATNKITTTQSSATCVQQLHAEDGGGGLT